jgi:hypothetical protein
MKTEILDGYFGKSLLRFAIAETSNDGAAFVAWYTVIDYLRALDAEELAYVVENWTIRRVFEEAHGNQPWKRD